MNEQRDVRIGDEVVGFLGGGIGGHDDGWAGRKRRRGKVGIVHEGDMWRLRGAGGEMELKRG